MGAATFQIFRESQTHVSREAATVEKRITELLCIGREMGVSTSWTESEEPLPRSEAEERFEKLAEEWRRECAHLSSIREKVLHPAYQQIIGMGKDALPLLLRELEREPDHWFWALWAITQENPVLPEHRGRVRLMAQDWLDWARRRGIRW